MVSHDMDNRPDDEVPLLEPKSKTPLPWKQIGIVFFALITEPLSSAYIFPYIAQLISELGITGGDDRKIGYYAGLIDSLFFVTQALTTWQWSRLSDFIGRRPVVLLGLLGLCVSNFCFGLSRTLGTLIISRCIAGVLNGNVGVMKSILGDLSDHTNMAEVFSRVPPLFCLGVTLGPLYGGALARPQDRWPHVFRGEFWEEYPYFLPSFVTSCFISVTFLVSAIFMKETSPSKVATKAQSERFTAEDPSDDPTADDAQPLPMMTLLTMPSVMIPIANFGTLALVELSVFIFLPLFYASPIEIGGLGFAPPVIGTFMGLFGVANGISQALFAAKIINWIGPKKLFCSAVLWFYPLILMFPLMSAIVTAQGRVGSITWVLILVQIVFMVLMELSYSVIAIFTTRASPNKQSLGSTNGLSQSLASIARAIGPAMTTSLFALSKEHNILGGNLVYVVLLILVTFLVFLSQRLPDLKRRH